MFYRLFLLSIIFCCCLLQVRAQNTWCGTSEPTPKQKELIYQSIQKQRQNKNNPNAAWRTTDEIVPLAVVVHFTGMGEGMATASEEDVRSVIEETNTYLANIDISLEISEFNYIDDYHTIIQSLTMNDMYDEHHIPDAINLFIPFRVVVNPISFGELCGLASLGGGPDLVIVANKCLNLETMLHEMGHYFSLLHTFDTQGMDGVGGEELVVRPGEQSVNCQEPDCTPLPANCEETGDLLCDTPADPNRGGSNDECEYVPAEGVVDANGDEYAPDPTNVMSYYINSCPELLTDGQYERMAITAHEGRRNHLIEPTHVFSFEMEGQLGHTVINREDHTVSLTVLDGVDLTNQSPTIGIFQLAEISPDIGTSQDFTSPVTYTVALGDMSQEWTVTVERPEPTDILSFELPEQAGEAVINLITHRVDIEVDFGTDRSSLVPTIAVPTGSSISPESAVAQDFSSTRRYTVTAADGETEQEWTVSVKEETGRNETNILSFALAEQISETKITHTEFTNTSNTHRVEITVASGTDLTSLTPTIEVSEGASLSHASGVSRDFTHQTIYTVTAEDGSTKQDWEVFVLTATSDEFRPFITVWQIAANQNLSIPFAGQERYGFDFEYVWKKGGEIVQEGSITSSEAESFNSSFTSSGKYELEITGVFPHFAYSHSFQTTHKLLDVVQWGDVEFFDMSYTFSGWQGSSFSATDTPNLRLVTNMDAMFFVAQNFNDDISAWDVSGVRSIGSTFYQTRMSVDNYDKILKNWSELELQPGVTFSNQSLYYCEEGEARQKIIDVYGWNITDGGAWCSDHPLNLVSFNVPGQINDPTISPSYPLIDIKVGFGTDITALTPTIEVASGSTVSPASGVTRDFTESDYMLYTVTAQDGESMNWFVSVTAANPNTETDIVSIALEAQDSRAVIDQNNHSINLEVLTGTDLTSLTPTIEVSRAASISPASGVSRDFTNAVTYTVTAEDGEATQEWEVTVTEVSEVLDVETDIVSFVLAEQINAATIDATDHSVTIEVVVGTDLSTLTPTLTLSEGATSSPASGEEVDFTNAVTYTVTAEDGETTQEWEVTVTAEEEELQNTDTDILTFQLAKQTGGATIDAVNHTIGIEVAFGTDFVALTPTLTLSEGATSSPASGEEVDFTNAVTYTVTAEDGETTQEWEVTVTEDSEFPDTDTDIVSFVLAEQISAATIDATDHSVTIEVVLGTDLSTLTPTLTLSEGATSSPASEEEVDFTNAVTYTITAEDGETIQDWEVTVKEIDNTLSIASEEQWEIYPNPINHVLHIKTKESVTVYLTDLSGRKLIGEHAGNDIELATSELLPGVYLLVVQSDEKISFRKIVKTKNVDIK